MGKHNNIESGRFVPTIGGMANNNTCVATNFVRVENERVFPVNSSSYPRASDGKGVYVRFFTVSDLLKSPTTVAHDKGHGFGLSDISNFRGNGKPNIMIARGALVDKQYQYDVNAKSGASGGTVNSTTQTFQQSNVIQMFKDLKFEYRKANIGSAANYICNSDGSKKK